jgi:hypothetical protein
MARAASQSASPGLTSGPRNPARSDAGQMAVLVSAPRAGGHGWRLLCLVYGRCGGFPLLPQAMIPWHSAVPSRAGRAPPAVWLAASLASLSPVCLSAEVHEQVAGLLRRPLPGRVQGDAEDADAPGRVLHHGQDVSLGAAGQVDGEEVAGQNRVGLGAQELRPGRTGPARRGADAVGLEDLPYGRRRYLGSQSGQFPVDPAVAPVGVLPGQPEDQGPDVRVAGRPVLPRMDLAARRRRRMSRCQRTMVSGVTSSRSPWRRASVSRRAGPRAGPGPPS